MKVKTTLVLKKKEKKKTLYREPRIPNFKKRELRKTRHIVSTIQR